MHVHVRYEAANRAVAQLRQTGQGVSIEIDPLLIWNKEGLNHLSQIITTLAELK